MAGTSAREYHVSPDGDDGDDGTAGAPLETVSAAARRARAGDAVVVHDGTYRERVDPPRGGRADARIVYRAAEGATPVVKGSEVVEGWERAGDGWTVTLGNGVFGDYNPFDDRIRGDWFDDRGREHHTGAVHLGGRALPEAESREALGDAERGWHATVEGDETTIRARFGGVDPRAETVEVNVRPAVFYPSSPGVDHIAVRGFVMRHAATQWAPPTTEQVGLLGTHWSRGWLIEDNVVSHSRCTGITLGKYGASVDDTGATAERYVETIREAREHGWAEGSVGGHVVRDNEIHHCGQAGIVGSMGAAFSEISANHVHAINAERAFRGAEIAGIKFHGPIDVTIRDNRIHRARRGIWLDWMTQGTRVRGNLCYANTTDDLFVEVNHGPFVVDTNLFLSETALRTWSQGGAYAHNLIAGDVLQEPELDRETPYHEARSTEIAGLSAIQGGDDRFFNNVFVGGTGLAPYDDAERPVLMAGNVFLAGARPSEHETDPIVALDAGTDLELIEDGERVALRVDTGETLHAGGPREVVTTDLLGRAAVPDLPFTEPDGSPLRIDADYFGTERGDDPTPGPFARPRRDRIERDLWPR